MKRTPLARATQPLRRYTPLAAVSAKRRAATQTPAGGLPPVSRPRVHRVPVDVDEKVKIRSKGWCEVQLPEICQGRASQKHHRITQKAGGRHGAAAERSDRPSNLLHCCLTCHDVITNRPLWAKRWEHGWSLSEAMEPALRPVLYRGDLVYLDDAGGVHDYETAGA